MCKICQLTMSQAMIMTTPEWVCGQCDYTSRSKQRRTRHVNMIHRGMKVHCDVEGCEYRGWHRSDVTQHWDRVHRSEGEKTVACDQCTYKGASLRLLKSHLRDIHIKTKKMWPCLQCGKTLRSAYNLKQHVKYLHAKFPRERNEIVTYYTCDQCTSYFVSRSSKTRHIRTRHERRGHHQPVERNVEQDAETVANGKKTFYRCPFKTVEEGIACNFDLSKDDIKWENSAMAVDHIQMYHFEQAKQETRIKWIKITT